MYVRKKMFIGYIILIILLIILPINGRETRINHTYILKLRLDYIFHALLFTPWMFFYDVVKFYTIFTNFKLFAWFCNGILFCIFSEVLQYIVPYRTFNINDMIANCIGIVLGLMIFILTWTKKIECEKTNY